MAERQRISGSEQYNIYIYNINQNSIIDGSSLTDQTDVYFSFPLWLKTSGDADACLVGDLKRPTHKIFLYWKLEQGISPRHKTVC